MNKIYFNTSVNQMNTICVNINLGLNSYPMATKLMTGQESALLAPKDMAYIQSLPSPPLSQIGWSPQSSQRTSSLSDVNRMSSGNQMISKSMVNNAMFDPIRYKTEMCKNFVELGHCKFGLNCYYAHFAKELKVPTYKHKNYKTQLCKPFHLEGFCDFGSRCAFVHSKPDVQKIVHKFDEFLSSALPMPDITSAVELNYMESDSSGADKRLKTFENISLNYN